MDTKRVKIILNLSMGLIVVRCSIICSVLPMFTEPVFMTSAPHKRWNFLNHRRVL